MRMGTVLGLFAACVVVTGLFCDAVLGADGKENPSSDLQGKAAVRGSYIIRNAYVMTMDPAIGDFQHGDVLVQNGVIVKVGADLGKPDAQNINGEGMIVMPGFVEAHWHMWNTFWRGVVNDRPEWAYFSMFRTAQFFQPNDSYLSVRLALTEALNAGITTVHNWANNVLGPQFADAELKAHTEIGLRARWSYGAPHGPDIDWNDVSRVRKQWIDESGGLLTLGIAATELYHQGTTIDDVKNTFAKARELGLPISIHSVMPGNPPGYQALLSNKLLGPDVQVLHACGSEAHAADIAATGAKISMSPIVEPLYSEMVPPIPEAMKAGVPLSISIDNSAIGAADMFSLMRTLLASAHTKTRDAKSPSARQLLEMATMGGAKDLGLQNVTGSITPGKRADLIMVRTTDINMQAAPDIDAAWLLVMSGRPENVDTVMVDGRILKQNGVVTVVDPSRVMKEAAQAFTALRARANLPPLNSMTK